MVSVVCNRKGITECGFLTKMTLEPPFKDEERGLDERKRMKIVSSKQDSLQYWAEVDDTEKQQQQKHI